jgi:peptide/nickel transport system ATP-binding protein/oligopeptide transport system ATP-binding protein
VPSPPAEITAERAVFRGKDLLSLPLGEKRKIRGKEIAMVFQEPMSSLNPVFTVGHQIEEAIRTHEKVSREAAGKRAVELLHSVGVPSPELRVRDYPHQLSGGQRQRVMIAMALACKPSLLIADEPTTALDVTIQAQILELFQKLRGDLDMSLLMITHDLGVVASMADRVYVMYAGLIVESGTAKEIFHETTHPYTVGLLASLPARAQGMERLPSIPGSVPDPAYKPPGCPFHPRCEKAVDSCREGLPEMITLSGTHEMRCPVVAGKKG